MKKTLILVASAMTTMSAYAGYGSGSYLGNYWINGTNSTVDINEIVDGKYVITTVGHDNNGAFSLNKGDVATTSTVSSLTVGGNTTLSTSGFEEATKVTVEELSLDAGAVLNGIESYVRYNNIVLGSGASIKSTIKFTETEAESNTTLINFTLADSSSAEGALAGGVSSYSVTVSTDGTIWNGERFGSNSLTFTFADRSSQGLVYLIGDNYYAAGTVEWTGSALQAKTGASSISLQDYSSYVVLDKDMHMSLTVTAPEPATASLSLLALAGLAARRRRH